MNAAEFTAAGLSSCGSLTEDRLTLLVCARNARNAAMDEAYEADRKKAEEKYKREEEERARNRR